MHRLVRPLAAAAICLTGLPLLAASGAPSSDDLGACRAKGQIRIRRDEWTEIKAPKVDTNAGEGAQEITDFTAPPFTHSRLYATNGTVIKVSADAGCTWSTMQNTAEVDKVDSTQTRQDVYTRLAAPTSGSLWAASYDEVGGVQHPHVYAAGGLADDSLTTPEFVEVSSGMAPAGKPVALAGSLTQPNLVYTLIEGPAPDPTSGDATTPARHLYVAYTPQVKGPDPAPPVDSPLGVMWKELPLPAGFSHVEGIEPALFGNGLWLWAGTKYAKTPDTLAGSVTWTTSTAPAPVTSIDSDLRGTTHVVYGAEQGGTERRYPSDSATPTESPLPTGGLYAHGSYENGAAVSGPGGVFGYDTRVKRWIRITPKGVPAFTKMTMPYGRQNRVVLGLANGTLYRYDTYAGELFVPPPPLPTGTGGWPTPPGNAVKVPVLNPVKEVVTVTPGELRTVPVDFRVPPAPNPVDVYFLLDTTGSMQPAIDGLKASIDNIATRLRKALGKDACFGLGDFRDFYPGDTQHTYVRDVPITCERPVEKIRTFMANMPPAAGGADIPEAQTIALTQAITGRGQKLPDPPVGAHQQAGFRADAYKIVVLISDSSFKQAAGYPSKSATINTLNVADVKVVSVLVSTDQGDHDKAIEDTRELALGTNTVAPAAGVDCDGNGQRTAGDLEANAPLVCDIMGSGAQINVGPAIVGLLLGVVDPGTVAVGVHDAANAIAQPIKGETSRVVNLKQPSALAFALPVSCSKAQDGLDLPIGLSPTVRALPVVLHGRTLYGEVVVRCRSIPAPKPPERPEPPPPRPQPEEPEFIPPPARPQLIAIAQPPPAPAQPLTNVNMNAGMSQQDEQQFQLAGVGQDAKDQEEEAPEEELAMSDFRQSDGAAAAFLFGGAAIICAGAGFAHRLRLQRGERVRTVRG